MMTDCSRTTREGSFSSGIWKYGVGRNCEGCGACDQATAAARADDPMMAGMISLFIESSIGLLRESWIVCAVKCSIETGPDEATGLNLVRCRCWRLGRHREHKS